MAYSTVDNVIPQLAGLTRHGPGARPIGLGGQNFTHCCLLALNASLTIEDGNLSYASPSFVEPGTSTDRLQHSTQNDEFPCGATFNGDVAGAPVVQVPYNWCEDQCPGWEISHFDKMRQWVGPLVQFIIPSLAFCTNVPRTRKLCIPDVVFKAHPRSMVGFCSYWVRLLGALLLMTLDTFAWLSICFAFAGPMLLSAVFEYALDRKVLEFLSPPKGKPPQITPRLRAQLLLAVVVGNIRMATVERNGNGPNGRHDSVMADSESGGGVCSHKMVHNSIWKRIMVMVDEYEEQRATVGVREDAVTLPTKLKALLNCQASFGSTVGAPILFFVGGFVYTVIDSENTLGDNDTAHALAFGMWWMVIPYLAIVACAMLAANSPSTLDSIVYDGGKTAMPDKYDINFLADRLQRAKANKPVSWMMKRIEGYNPVETAFEGRFKTVKLWKRGLNKLQWIEEAIVDYTLCTGTTSEPSFPEATTELITPAQLRETLKVTKLDCWYVASGALFLVLAPCVLAFVTSFNVPRAGLSCRSLTYLVYALSQVGEMILWTWAARLRIRYGSRWYAASPVAKRVCWYGQVFIGFFAILAAVGGTMMQLLGVFRSCACKVPATYWLRLRDPDAFIILSDNTAADIRAALDWWTVTGSVAVGVVGIVCALAWWHQRRLRKVFRDEADKFDEDYVSPE
ncbi:hypothetical protein F4780DRAFT_770484 [Xylariomycetidae sp. FL0641]|nr:hypothetical protein F4780DRAFT_770484 [Xylariomycetidae sp. FL0641]